MAVKVLVADDSATIQKVIKIAFSRYPVRVVEASSYHEAMNSAGSLNPDLCIVDASLVGTSTPDDFVRLRKAAGECPMLLLLGSYEKIDESRFYPLGLSQFIRKPFDTNDLIKKISDDLGISLEEFNDSSEDSNRKNNTGPEYEIPSKKTEYIPPPIELKAEARQPSDHNVKLGSGDDPFDSIRELDSENDFAQTLPMTDLDAKGRPAFGKEDKNTLTKKKPSVEFVSELEHIVNDQDHSDIEQKGFSASLRNTEPFSREELRNLVTPIMREELRGTVKETVLRYCEEHFNELAREIILRELRRLAQEKSKHLADT
ncbi:MAG: response regulator [Bdellovibrionota bacterium]